MDQLDPGSGGRGDDVRAATPGLNPSLNTARGIVLGLALALIFWCALVLAAILLGAV